jgi:hypothetical protein
MCGHHRLLNANGRIYLHFISLSLLGLDDKQWLIQSVATVTRQ